MNYLKVAYQRLINAVIKLNFLKYYFLKIQQFHTPKLCKSHLFHSSIQTYGQTIFNNYVYDVVNNNFNNVLFIVPSCILIDDVIMRLEVKVTQFGDEFSCLNFINSLVKRVGKNEYVQHSERESLECIARRLRTQPRPIAHVSTKVFS